MSNDEKEMNVVGDIVAGIEMHGWGWELYSFWLPGESRRGGEIITIVGYTKFWDKYVGMDEDGNRAVYTLEHIVRCEKTSPA